MRIEENFDLTLYNSYRIKSTCKRAFFPTCETDFIHIYENKPEVKKIILGGGFNVIFSKEYYEEDFILVGQNFSNVRIQGCKIEAEAGSSLESISKMALAHSLTGMEIFYDIPSTMGGAVVMNAGASGEEIKDILVKVRYLDLTDMKIKEILREEMNFEYRNSYFQENTNKIILKVFIELIPGVAEVIKDKMERIKAARWDKQPKEFPNAGSVFKRPEGFFVGSIIDSLGLKGYTSGGAKISEKHGGFIVNFQNATGEDVISIIELVQRRVKREYKIDLQIEQRVI